MKIKIVSDDNVSCALFIASLAETLFNYTLSAGGKRVTADISGYVSLTADEKKLIADRMRASAAASAYGLSKAFKNPSAVPGNLDVEIRFEDLYCGNLDFSAVGAAGDIDEQTDTVIFAVSSALHGNQPDILKRCGKLGIPVICAVRSENYAQVTGESAESAFSALSDRKETLCRVKYYGWYNYYGFTGSNELLDEDNAHPYKFDDIFRNSAAAAAVHRRSVLVRRMADSEKVISQRVSVYCGKSMRRNKELAMARQKYSVSAFELVPVENMVSAMKTVSEE